MRIIATSLSLSILLATVTAVPAHAQRPRPSRFPGRSQAAPRRPAPAAQSISPVATAQERRLEQILRTWEQRSATIEALRAEFYRYYYDAVFPQRDEKTGKVIPDRKRGELVYQAPDQGVFHVYNNKRRGLRELIDKDEERWICTGTELYQYDIRLGKVTVTPLPPEIRGNAISEGPLPFIFGMKADHAKQRYRMRLTRLSILRPQDVCIEVLPRWNQDLANFSRALVVLDTKSYLPRMIQIDEPRSTSAAGNAGAAPSASVSFSRYYFYGINGQSTIAVNAQARVSEREFRPSTRGFRVIRNEAVADREPEQPQRRNGLLGRRQRQ